MIVQFEFVSRKHTDMSILTLFSLTLTILSLISSITTFTSRIIRLKIKYSEHVQQIFMHEICLVMHNVKSINKKNKFRKRHGFTNRILHDNMLKALRSEEDNKSWNDRHRSDRKLTNDVFFVECDTGRQEITFYSHLTLACYADKATEAGEKLRDSIKAFGDNQSKIQDVFIHPPS